MTVKVAHLRLCHSRMLFVRAYPRETQEMVFDAHDRAFAFFKGACDLADMLMMGEIDHLAYLGHFGEEPECLLGAKIVEGLHDVVGDKRHRAT